MKDTYDKLIIFLKRINVPGSRFGNIEEPIEEYNLQGVNVFIYKYWGTVFKFAYNSNEDTILFRNSYTKSFISITSANKINSCLSMVDGRFKEYDFNLFLKCNLI